jgi:hypothetical protein
MGAWGHGPRENDTALDMEHGLVSEMTREILDSEGLSGGYQAQGVYYAAMLCMESKTLREAWSQTSGDDGVYEAFGNFVARMARRLAWTESQVEWFDKALPVLEAAELGGTSLLDACEKALD